VSGTFCAKHPKGEFLAKGTGHLFPARSLLALIARLASPDWHRPADSAAKNPLA